MNEKEKRNGGGGGRATGTTFNGKRDIKFTAMKVPRQCPFVLLVKDGFGEGKAFGSGEGKQMNIGARREVEQNLTSFLHNYEF
jgi:hypothetical protein